MSGPTYPTDIPIISMPFVDKNGYINEPWFLLLVNLFRRTGGGGGQDVTQIINIPDETLTPVIGLGADDVTALNAALVGFDIQAQVQTAVQDALTAERSQMYQFIENKLSEMLFSPLSTVVGSPAPEPLFTPPVSPSFLTEMTMGVGS